jgi:hypothetical protein
MRRSASKPAKGRSSPRVVAAAVAFVLTGLVSVAGTAFSYFALPANGSAQAKGAVLDAPGAGSVNIATATAVALPVGWADSANLPASGGNPDGYEVFRSTTNGSQGSEVTSGGCAAPVAQSATTTSCTDSGLTPNTTYYYQVVAAYDSWTSAPDAQFSATTPKQATTTALSSISPTRGTTATSFGATVTVAGDAGYGTPAGSVVFSLYTSQTCSGSPSYSTAAQPLTNATASASMKPGTTGTYYWGATYTPSDTYNLSSSTCASGTPITVSSFGAADLGSSSSAVAGHALAGPSVSTTTAATELIFVNLVGSNGTASTIASISGPFSGTPVAIASKEYPGPTSRNYVFAWQATGSGGTGPVTVTLDAATTLGTGQVDVVQLNPGDLVAGSSGGAGVSSGKSVPVTITPANPSDSEVVFLGEDGSYYYTPPPATPPWLLVSGSSTSSVGWGTFSDSAIQSSATFSTSKANKDYGYEAVEVNP